MDKKKHIRRFRVPDWIKYIFFLALLATPVFGFMHLFYMRQNASADEKLLRHKYFTAYYYEGSLLEDDITSGRFFWKKNEYKLRFKKDGELKLKKGRKRTNTSYGVIPEGIYSMPEEKFPAISKYLDSELNITIPLLHIEEGYFEGFWVIINPSSHFLHLYQYTEIPCGIRYVVISPVHYHSQDGWTKDDKLRILIDVSSETEILKTVMLSN